MMSSPSFPAQSQSSAAEQQKFVKAGNALLSTFEKYKFFDDNEKRVRSSFSQFTDYISIGKMREEFKETRNHFKEQSRTFKDEGMEERVVCYLLGRTYTGPTLQVLIQDPSWLEPICVGLTLNVMVVNLHIHFFAVLAEALGDDDSRHDDHGVMAKSLQHIASLLERSSTVTGLHVSSTLVLDRYADYIAQVVRTNKLHKLDIISLTAPVYSRRVQVDPDESECQKIAEALMVNTSIKVLWVEALPTIIKTFVWEDSKAANRVVEDLTLQFRGSHFLTNSESESDIVDLKRVLSTNKTLSKLSLPHAKFSESTWLQIIDCLKVNTNLQEIDIRKASGWADTTVLDALLNLLRVHCPQIIDLKLVDREQESSLGAELLKEYVPALDEQLRLNMGYSQVLKDAPKGPPRSARVVFCGPGYAGKTTLCKTMLRQEPSRLGRQTSKFLQKRPELWRCLCGPDADKELHKRTRGVAMHRWKEQPKLKISLWDFAGQAEYYALHDYMFPNVGSANLFLFTFSLSLDPSGQNADVLKRLRAIEERELLFWLRFLCSNSKKMSDPKPLVRIVFTGKDRVTDSTICLTRSSAIFGKFKSRFESRLQLVGPIMLLNACSERSVQELETQIETDFTDMIPMLQPTLTIFEEVQRKLDERMNVSPVITIDDYNKICEEVDSVMFRGEESRQAAASYLHNVGEIIYFRVPDLNFIVIDPRWLGLEVLGNLLHVFSKRSGTSSNGIRKVMDFFRSPRRSLSLRKVIVRNGFVDQEGLKVLLKESLHSVSTDLEPEKLIQLLTALEICFKDDDQKGYLIPAAFDREELAHSGLRALHWHAITEQQTYTYVGRRLQCADQELTSLTPGFFPRLQVVLRKHLVKERFVGHEGFCGFEIDRNLLRFYHNGMDVIIEYVEGEQYRGNFVDVLVKTSQDYTLTVKFLQEHVLDVIRKFSAQPEGNQGVGIAEGIIRPKSVENLVPCKHRENQAVLISDLEKHLKEDGSYRLCWNAVEEGRAGGRNVREEAYAIDVIRGEGFYQKTMQEQNLQSEAISRIFEEQLKEPLTNFLSREQVLPDTPKLVYILEDKRGFSPLGSSDVRMRLHLKCESRHSLHFVPDQRGRSFVFQGEVSKILTPLVQWTYQLLKLGGIGVAKSLPFFGALEVVVGMLPDRIRTPARAFFDLKSVKEMGIKGKEIVRFYEEMLQASPRSEWLRQFLDLQGQPNKFKEDFQLEKVKYKDTQQIAFLCETCKSAGLQSKALVLP